MRRGLTLAAPSVMMGIGTILLLGIDRQRAAPLRAPLTIVPTEILGRFGQDRAISPEDQRAAGMSQYVLRDYGGAFSVYVGYYEQQTQGRTIHSPRNCLPGAGWEPVEMSDQAIAIGANTVRVRRYVIMKGQSRALVYYWYQGRGRITSNEYRVKWELLRDAALRGRTEEALVRIVLPLTGEAGEPAADSLATRVAAAVIPAVDRALPEFH